MSGKIDLERALDGDRARRGELRQLDLPPARYLAVDGAGDPTTSPAFAAALHSLYPAATLHVGSFDEEAPVLARVHDEYGPEHDLRLTGRHHEIHLSDRRRTPPERRRTIVRQPVRPREDDRG
ncbi:hypothetical protein [Nocardioides marmoraquaticus]